MRTNHLYNKWMQFKVSTLTAAITSVLLAGVSPSIIASDIDIYQSGGNGPTMIYLMLDTSGSMNNNSSMTKDYNYSYITQEYECSGSRFGYEDVGNKKGDYSRERGIFGIWVYYYVGNNKGNYKQKCGNYDVTNNTCDIKNISNTSGLNVGSYTYAKKDTDLYCEVDTKIAQDNGANQNYISKIKNTCDQIGTSTKYNCYSRIVNLRRGLLSLVNGAEIKENISFALGQYPKPNTNSEINHILDFTKMNSTGKASLSGEIVKLVGSGGTPISLAYDNASKKLLSSATAPTGNINLNCTGKGVYFLTDGEPSTGNGYTSGSFDNIRSTYSISLKNTKNLGNTYWGDIGKFAESIKDSKYKIKTATVGFGGEYYLPDTTPNQYVTINQKKYYNCGVLSGNQKELCEWGAKKIPDTSYSTVGGLGEGGFYNPQSADELLKSVLSFVSEVEVPVEGTTIGSSTIPVDALNTSQLQPYAYFPTFKPLIGAQNQLWAGNLKKFNVSNGSLYDTLNKAVFKNKQDINDELKDYWYNSKAFAADKQLSYGGSLSQLLGEKIPTTTNILSSRNLFINSGENGELENVAEILSTSAVENKDYLFGLLGFSKLTPLELTELLGKSSYQDKITYLKNKIGSATSFQKGAVIHSSPILLTQAGALVEENGGISSAERKDYILYGTTQGVIHVVKAGQQKEQVIDGTGIDSTGGEEIFAFVPKEMLHKQKEGFFEGHAQSLKEKGFFYGIDAPWASHTVYEPSFYEVEELDSNGNPILDANQNPKTIQREGLVVKPDSELSYQYVYGGLRMGGRSYYALNLSDINHPKMLFHIDPDNAAAGTPISYMGQSWSKPSLAYIKWNGKKKLAMIVGGGYDAGINNNGGYEDPNFVATTTSPAKGNGVYIFDAVNGDLLWWGSSSATTQEAEQDKDSGSVIKPAATRIADMYHSIPSRVKVIDRDSDGIADHLYVGDLGGNLFRIDLNNQHYIKSDESDPKQVKFIKNAASIAQIKEETKNPVRFFEAPTFTIHSNISGGKFAVVTIASGDRSNPLKVGSSASQDVIVGIYDKGVTALNPTVPNSPIRLNNLKEIYKTGTATGGWYYKLAKETKGTGADAITYQSKGVSEGVALDHDLYYSIFDPQKKQESPGSSNSCSGGIIGESVAYQLCLPSGECSGSTSIKQVGNLGAGIISLAVGIGSTPDSRRLIMNNPDEVKSSITEYSTRNKLIPTRWYEYSPAYKKVN